MADVRALLAAERQSRRISHPHLTYSKSGALTCTVCNLNVRSEQLWPGHLKSLNHRKNIQKISTEPPRPAKRKIESVEDNEDEERNYDVDTRKKPKPAPNLETIETVTEDVVVLEPAQKEVLVPVTGHENTSAQPQQRPTPPKGPNDVDEDEWAAFEREVAPLAQENYPSATIEAAPVSAAEVATQQRTNAVQEREDEAEAEKEDESRRMEEEFEIMEEMEDRVKRLRARREALRPQDPAIDTAPNAEVNFELAIAPSTDGTAQNVPGEREDTVNDQASSEEEEIDDWYG